MQPRWPLTEERIKRCGTYTRRGLLLSQEKGTSVKYMCNGRLLGHEKEQMWSAYTHTHTHTHTVEYYSAVKRNKCGLHICRKEYYSAMKKNNLEVHI